MKVLLLIATLIACSQAYSYKIAADVKHPGVCMYNGKTLQIGENRLSYRCEIVHCYEDGSIYVEGCGKLGKIESHLIDYLNIEKAYPECCKYVSLEQGQVQGLRSTLDSQIYNEKKYYPQRYYYKGIYPLGYYAQGELDQSLYSQKYYPQGEYSQRYYPQVYQQGEYTHRYYPQGYKQSEYSHLYYPLGPLGYYQQFSQRYYPQGYQQGEYSQRYYPQVYQEGEYSQRYYPQGYQQGEYSQRYPMGHQEGEYSHRYYPQGYYNQEQYQNYGIKNQDYMSEYRQEYPLSYLIRRPYLLDYMFGRRVNV